MFLSRIFLRMFVLLALASFLLRVLATPAGGAAPQPLAALLLGLLALVAGLKLLRLFPIPIGLVGAVFVLGWLAWALNGVQLAPPTAAPAAAPSSSSPLERLRATLVLPPSPGESSLTAQGPVVPAQPGVVLLRFFIPGSRAAGGVLKGDDRGYSSDPDASYRVAVYWDTREGTVMVRVSESCRKGLRGFAFDPHHPCRHALPIVTVPESEVWRHRDERRHTNIVALRDEPQALRLRVSVLNSYSNTVPGKLMAWSVDEDVALRMGATPRLELDGNGYPAVEALFYPEGGGVVMLGRRDIEHPHVSAVGLVPFDGGGGDAANDAASWAQCRTAVGGGSMSCNDTQHPNLTWVTTWPS